MMLQRLATGATGVKQARYRRRPTRGSEALVRACAVYTQQFRRGFCTLVLSFSPALMYAVMFYVILNKRKRLGDCVTFLASEGDTMQRLNALT